MTCKFIAAYLLLICSLAKAEFTNANILKAEKIISNEYKLPLKSVRIANVSETDDTEFSFFVSVKEKIKYLGNDLDVGSQMLYSNDAIATINLPNSSIFKIDGLQCSHSVSFSKKNIFCSCEISKDITVNGYIIKAPAGVVFKNGKFKMFQKRYPLTAASSTVDRQYYEITKKGKAMPIKEEIKDEATCNW